MDGRPVGSGIPAKLIDFPHGSLKLIDLGQVMVSLADPDPSPGLIRELDLISDERGWESRLDPWEDLDRIDIGLTPEWQAFWGLPTLAFLAVDHPCHEFSSLIRGPLNRRINAIYDRLDFPFSTHQLQERFAQVAQAVVTAAESGHRRAANLAASFGLSFAGGYFGQLGAAGHAIEWLESLGKQPSALQLDLAKVVMVWTLLPEGEDRSPGFERAMLRRCQKAAKALPASSAADTRRTWAGLLDLLQA